MDYITCTVCQNEFPGTEEYFYCTRKTVKDKKYAYLRKQCKVCVITSNNERRKRDPQKRRDYEKKRCDENRQKVRDENRLYQQSHKEAVAGYRKKWRSQEQNKLKTKISSQIYYLKNKTKINLADKNWRENNKDKKNRITHRYMAKKRNLDFHWTEEDWNFALGYWNHQCAVCKNSDKTLHKDHWIPLSYSEGFNPGTVPSNIIPLCSSCNSSKCSSLPEEWLRSKYPQQIVSEILDKVRLFFSKTRLFEIAPPPSEADLALD